MSDPLKDIASGTDLATQAELDAVAALIPASTEQRAVLSANLTAITSQPVLQDITGLGVTVGASATEILLVRWYLLFVAANGTMDLKLGLTVPSGCTVRWGGQAGAAGSSNAVAGWGSTAAGNTPPAIATESSTITLGTSGSAGAQITGIVFGGGTGGTVQLQYAQGTSDGASLQILKGTCFEAKKLAS